MSFLSTCNFCVMMIWQVSINLSSSFSRFGIGSSGVCTTDDFANHFRFRRIPKGWVANHHLRFGRHIASSAVAVTRISGTCSSGGGAGRGTVGISIGAVAVGIPSSRRRSRVRLGAPESISTLKFHFVPRASIVSRRVHCSP